MYEVQWSRSAAEDLFVKVTSAAVAEELCEVSRTLLDEPPSKDGGPIPVGFWRRGATRSARPDTGTAGERAWDYVLVYRPVRAVRRTYRVIAVLTNAELAAGLAELEPLDTVPLLD
ncbi:hypothetical protein [Saccharothrix violaceirubra]|uniref:Type II toxin-antitoxin system RelE/ParE family toxin n=1 Tax=Saccharothrix violaceirubra TaxID=413306 RepID=A0A7W7WZ40_9PSEU|nr:hypothetical protein [Saccharothrix violaceirubra]MBB4969169.1 hypothetical protein [Saccharothrix violaceirubra]